MGDVIMLRNGSKVDIDETAEAVVAEVDDDGSLLVNFFVYSRASAIEIARAILAAAEDIDDADIPSRGH